MAGNTSILTSWLVISAMLNEAPESLYEHRLYDNIGRYLVEQARFEGAILDDLEGISHQVCFMWVNRRAHSYDYKISHNFCIPDVVYDRHVAGYLLHPKSEHGLELRGGEPFRFIVLKGVFTFVCRAAGVEPKGFVQTLHQLSTADEPANWQDDLVPAARHLLRNTTIGDSPVAFSPDELLQEYEDAIREVACRLDDVALNRETFERALQELLLRIRQQPMFTGFLIRKVDPAVPGSVHLFKSFDLSQERPFEPSLDYLVYTILAAFESYFFAGELFETIDELEGEPLYKTAIAGAPLTVGGADGMRDFLGAAFFLTSYRWDANTEKAYQSHDKCARFLEKWRPEVSRIVSRVTSRELQAKLIGTIENAEAFSDEDFVRTFVANLHLVSDAYARFFRWPTGRSPATQQCDDSTVDPIGSFPLRLADDFCAAIRTGQPIDYNRYFWTIDGASGEVGKRVLSPECLGQLLTGDSQMARQSPPNNVIESRSLRVGELEVPGNTSIDSCSASLPYGHFKAYFVCPLLWEPESDQPLGIIEFFFPSTLVSDGLRRPADTIRLKLYGLISELMAAGELYRAYRRVGKVYAHAERNRVEHEWIALLTHNIKSGCNLDNARKRLQVEIPEELHKAVSAGVPLSKDQLSFVNNIIGRFKDASNLLKETVDLLEIVESMFVNERLHTYKDFRLGFDTVRRLVEGYRQRNQVDLEWPSVLQFTNCQVQCGTLQVLWHVLLNAINAAARVEAAASRRVRLKARQANGAFTFTLFNQYFQIGWPTPDYSAENQLLRSLWWQAGRTDVSDGVQFKSWGDNALTAFSAPSRTSSSVADKNTLQVVEQLDT